MARVITITQGWLTKRENYLKRESYENETMKGMIPLRRSPRLLCGSCNVRLQVGDTAVRPQNGANRRKVWCADCAMKLHIITKKDMK